MRNPSSPENVPLQDDRPPGRSFEDPSRPLGAELIDPNPSEAQRTFVANRAKAISILRKAEEFMRSHNPSGTTPDGVLRALELAAGRMGLKLSEYDAIVGDDPELRALERRVIDDVRRRG